MKAAEALRMAGSALWGRKLRSAMTITGVVIGVASVLAVTSLGAAFEDSIVSEFDDVDNRSVWVYPTTIAAAQGPPDAGQFGTIFTEVDRQAVAAIAGVERVSATGGLPVTGLASGDVDIPFERLSATQADADEVRNLDQYHAGGPFADGADELVLGWQIASFLGGGEPLAVGATVEIGLPDGSSRNATVAGVLAESEVLFGSVNGEVYVPIDPFYTVKRESPNTGEVVSVFDGFSILATDPREVDDVRDRVSTYMLEQSDASQLLTEGLTIEVATPGDIQDQIGAAFDTITIFIAAIAAVSLLVGGIMIGTIMLINVAERTKEIGMMKAIGARDREVLRLFLFESGLVGIIGTIIGIVIGLGAGAILVSTLFSGDDGSVSFIVPWDWLIISTIVGIGTGVIAGLLPARRAVRVEPVEALSYE